MRVGVILLPTDPWAETVTRAQHLEALGYDHLWTYDHLSWQRYRERDWHAAIPWLTGIAMATTTMRLGTIVASPNFRHPVTLAKEAMTLDHISSGRLTLGIGAGGSGFDATVLGDEPLTPAQRAARFVEWTEVLDKLLRVPGTSHRGEWYTVDDARTIPACVQQPRLPLAIAATGPKTLELVARLADTWITYGTHMADDATAEETEGAVRRQADILETACGRHDRDPATIRRLYMIGSTAERPLASVAAFVDFAGRYAAMGFTDLVFHHPRADDPAWDEPEAIVDEIATNVLPTMR
jgi:alkanesulfonate monooxygenase SsuD/methylene tetrahydromethanopterin reductase-like flavin-dependent oxidoreductase (luciferase family)